MGIIRKNSSGRAVHFITDEGVVYSASLTKLLSTLEKDNSKGNVFLLFSKYPHPVNPTRYPQSPIYDPEKGIVNNTIKPIDGLSNNNDAYSNKSRAEVIQVKKDLHSYSDKNVWEL
jgi:hypothetical protein